MSRALLARVVARPMAASLAALAAVLRVAASMAAAAALAIALSAAPLAAQEADPLPSPLELPVRVDTLENGMRVLALRRAGGPTASFVLRFGVGSIHEPAGRSGVAHLLEHLLFKGTTTIGTRGLAEERALFRAMDAAQDSLRMGRPGGLGLVAEARLRDRIEALEDSARAFAVSNEFTELLVEEGARNLNATTGREATTYFVSLPANRAELWFLLEADRMVNPVFREFYAERSVVAEEYRTRVGSPDGRLTTAFFAEAYRVHPYGRPVLGRPAELEALTRDDVARFHARYYRPDNAVVAVVGNVDPDRIAGLARRYFGPIPPGGGSPSVEVEEPPQTAERRVRLELDAAPELLVGWRVPGGDHDDAAALSVLVSVLGGPAGRLHRRLVVEDGLAGSVTVSLVPGFHGPRQLTVQAQPLGDATTDDLEAALYDEVRRLTEDPPSGDELARVRNQTEAARVRQLGSQLGLALGLAESALRHGDWREAFRARERLAGVTAADVRRVAETYLRPERRTVAVLVPEEDP